MPSGIVEASGYGGWSLDKPVIGGLAAGPAGDRYLALVSVVDPRMIAEIGGRVPRIRKTF